MLAISPTVMTVKFTTEQLAPTPSTLEGLVAEEQRLRHLEATRLIRLVSTRLRLPVLTTATALVYYQVFFAARSLTAHDHIDVAATALFSACKAEDTPKRAKEICCVAMLVATGVRRTAPAAPVPIKDGAFKASYAAPLDGIDDALLAATINDASVRDARERVFRLEKDLLELTGFEFDVPHGFAALVLVARTLGIDRTIAQAAWQILLDSYGTSLYLHCDPATMAVGALTLASGNVSVAWWVAVAPAVSAFAVKDFLDEMQRYYAFCDAQPPGAEVPVPLH